MCELETGEPAPESDAEAGARWAWAPVGVLVRHTEPLPPVAVTHPCIGRHPASRGTNASTVNASEPARATVTALREGLASTRDQAWPHQILGPQPPLGCCRVTEADTEQRPLRAARGEALLDWGCACCGPWAVLAVSQAGPSRSLRTGPSVQTARPVLRQRKGAGSTGETSHASQSRAAPALEEQP